MIETSGSSMSAKVFIVIVGRTKSTIKSRRWVVLGAKQEVLMAPKVGGYGSEARSI